MKKASEDILRAIVIGAALFVICSSPSGTRRVLSGIKKEWNKRNTRLALDRLYKKEFVSYKELSDGTLRVVATKQGRAAIKNIDLENVSITKQARWDKKWRLVAFDVPEERKRGREALRNMLYKLGFYKLQKSIFVHPYPCNTEIDLVCNIFGIRPQEVMIAVAESVPQESRLRKFFQLV